MRCPFLGTASAITWYLDLYRWPDGSRIMTKKFAFLIVAAMGLSAPAYAQSVRVITGDIEHAYEPGGQLLAMMRSERGTNARRS